MKILGVTHFYESHRGGIEIVAGRLARELHSLGHDIVWAASRKDEPPAGEWLRPAPLATIDPLEKIVGLPMPIPTPAGIWKLVREVRRADAVIVHDGLYATSVIALVAAKLASKPVLLVQHIAEIPFRSRLLAAVMRLANRIVTRPMLRAADQAVFISETTARHFGGLRFRRAPLTIFNGVDTAIFTSGDAPEKAALRSEFSLPAGNVALFVGRFVEKKGLSVLRELARLRPDVHFALAGWGPIDPGSWGLANVSIFSSLSGPRLAALYRACDMLVLPSVGEGFPLVVQEALASNLMVLCGAETAAADPAAESLLLGFPVDLAEPEQTARAFAEGIDAAGRLPADDRRICFAQRHYSWPAAATAYDAALRAIAGKSEERRPSRGAVPQA
jgi:starch synthase